MTREPQGFGIGGLRPGADFAPPFLPGTTCSGSSYGRSSPSPAPGGIRLPPTSFGATSMASNPSDSRIEARLTVRSPVHGLRVERQGGA